MLVTVHDLHHELSVVPQKLCLYLELLHHSDHLLLYNFVILHGGECQDLFELGHVVMADPLGQHCFIEDQHSVKVLDSLREFIAQFVEVEVEPLAVEALADADKCLQLRDYHCLLCLPADPDDCLDLLLVHQAGVDELTCEAVPGLNLHHRNVGSVQVVYLHIEEVA